MGIPPLPHPLELSEVVHCIASHDMLLEVDCVCVCVFSFSCHFDCVYYNYAQEIIISKEVDSMVA